MAIPNKTVNEMLKQAFKPKHSDAAVKHFQAMVDDYQKSEWADASAKGGKFVEATVKALWDSVGETVPKSKDFSVGGIVDKLQQKPATAGIPDTIKLTIPRACRFAYEIASNRGARHDADEIDANEMDASAVVSVCSWILSEMVRFSQHGLEVLHAKAMIEGLMRRRFPFTEEIDGRIYSEIGNSAPERALAILFHIYPNRMAAEELVKTLIRHEYKEQNATKAVERLARFVDDDGAGNMRLRTSGVRRAEEMISAIASERSRERKARRSSF